MKRFEARRREKKREKIKKLGIFLFLIGLSILLPIWEEAEHVVANKLIMVGTPLIIIGFLIIEAIESVEKHNPLDKWLNQ